MTMPDYRQFSDDDQFFRFSTAMAKLMAEMDGNLDLFVRILLHAMSDSNRIGHTVYGNRKLRSLLTRLDTKTGELIAPNRDSIRDAIEKLIGIGFLAPESTARCLVVSSQIGSNGATSRSTECRIHRVGSRYEPKM